jgi:hypothetical protein
MITLEYPLINKVRDFVSKLFQYFRTTNVEPIPDVEFKQKVEQRKPRKYNKERAQDFSELLDHLEHTFNNVKLPTMNESWLAKDSVIGLKKLGVHVPNPWITADGFTSKGPLLVDVSKPLPAMMSISHSSQHTINTKHTFYVKFIFAIKMKKLPWHVTQQSGIPFQYGMAFDVEGKLIWVNMYLTINKTTGVINFCDELQTIPHTVPAKSPSARRRANGKATTFARRSWIPPRMLEDDQRTIDEGKVIAQNFFVSMHEWWSDRDSRWNVVVKKNGDRVTFGVDNDQTPYYFKDRDKSIRTPSGQAKKIVHYVKEHERKYGDKTTIVKEHIRGLQEFDWSGYECKVISPKLQNKTSAQFTVPSSDSEDIKDIEDSNIVYMSRVGKVLADFEERKKVA